mgnify:CR=1 FL=1
MKRQANNIQARRSRLRKRVAMLMMTAQNDWLTRWNQWLSQNVHAVPPDVACACTFDRRTTTVVSCHQWDICGVNLRDLLLRKEKRCHQDIDAQLNTRVPLKCGYMDLDFGTGVALFRVSRMVG